MTLHVQSARIDYRAPDRLDITRKSGTDGLFLAPSWKILRPALDAMRAGRTEDAWSAYVPAYVAEMKASYRAHHAAWAALLARDRVVLCCYCTDPDHCHRAILRARILPALGAVDEGEVRA